MHRGIFVTGTDTGVGKTVVSAALMVRYRPACPTLRYWKPVQTGIEQDDDTSEMARLSGVGEAAILREGVRLPRPVSPHLAARLSGTSIDIRDLRTTIGSQPPSTWIVEGAGGVLVPLNESDLMVDLMEMLGMPVVVAARSGLGTINHTLLTLEALRARGLRTAGVVMVGEPNDENRLAIEKYGSVGVIGQLPQLEPLTPEALGACAVRLDPNGTLAEWFA